MKPTETYGDRQKRFRQEIARLTNGKEIMIRFAERMERPSYERDTDGPHPKKPYRRKRKARRKIARRSKRQNRK